MNFYHWAGVTISDPFVLLLYGVLLFFLDLSTCTGKHEFFGWAGGIHI